MANDCDLPAVSDAGFPDNVTAALWLETTRAELGSGYPEIAVLV